MKLEQQVVSLELAQKLKELGVKQKGYNFYWAKCLLNETEDGKTRPWWLLFPQGDNVQAISDFPDWYDFEDFDWIECATAFTVAELGEMLPTYFACHKRDEVGDWICYDNNYNKITDEVGRADTEADARGKMLVYLLENKLITL